MRRSHGTRCPIPLVYTHEWASFSTRDFPANRDARTGDLVRIVITDTADHRPVEDVLTYDQPAPNPR